jgi:hypothetical protein
MQCFIVPAQTQQTRVQRLSPENKGVSPYIYLQAGYRSKKQGLIHICLYLILLAISSLVLWLSSCSDFSSFISTIPNSLLISQDSVPMSLSWMGPRIHPTRTGLVQDWEGTFSTGQMVEICWCSHHHPWVAGSHICQEVPWRNPFREDDPPKPPWPSTFMSPSSSA